MLLHIEVLQLKAKKIALLVYFLATDRTRFIPPENYYVFSNFSHHSTCKRKENLMFHVSGKV